MTTKFCIFVLFYFHWSRKSQVYFISSFFALWSVPFCCSSTGDNNTEKQMSPNNSFVLMEKKNFEKEQQTHQQQQYEKNLTMKMLRSQYEWRPKGREGDRQRENAERAEMKTTCAVFIGHSKRMALQLSSISLYGHKSEVFHSLESYCRCHSLAFRLFVIYFLSICVSFVNSSFTDSHTTVPHLSLWPDSGATLTRQRTNASQHLQSPGDYEL